MQNFHQYNSLMTRFSLLLVCLFLNVSLLQAQQGEPTATATRLDPVQPAATVNVKALGQGFDPNIQFLAPAPGGEGYQTLLQQRKAEVDERFPRTEEPASMRSGGAEPPLLLTEFAGNNSTGSTPMDNHLAVSNDGQIVSVINRHFAVKDPAGDWLGAATLNNLISDLGLDNLQFDPRILYDPNADRFIIFMMHGFGSSTSRTIVGFSQTADATGDWVFYTLTGNPFSDGTWSDYPIVAMTDTEVFVTVNQLLDNSTWQAGFTQSIIWQIGKEEGYNGDPLEVQMWSDVNFNGAPIRNLCPVNKGDGMPGDNLYLLSNRNFDLENDSIFILELTGTMDDPDTELLIDVQQADVPYGLAPDGLQEVGTLATNDARILDAFIHEGMIQFVGNCVDPGTGQAAIYHGLIEDLEGDRTITGYIVNGGPDDIGYPAIAYTGVEPGDQDAIIVFSHSSVTRYAGCSAIYFDNTRAHSELVTIKEGLNYIDMQPQVDQERWGDYAGNQRRYNDPGVVWVAASFGEVNKSNDTWIGELGRPDLFVSTEEESISTSPAKVFPNPASDRVNVQFEIPADTEMIRIQLIDATGRTIRTFMDDHAKKTGLAAFSFAVDPLPTGVYYLQISADQQQLHTETIVVE
jgi:hypothetical protein